MVTVGGATSGYCAIGRTCEATSPASVMMIAMTPEKIGRSMKNLDSMSGTPEVSASARRLAVLRCGWLCGRRRISARLGGRRHRRTRANLQQVVHDDAVAGRKPAENRP